MNVNANDSLSLSHIAGWQFVGSDISLPSVQRDFVWGSYQIENLWDSILRGYPIGCFVLGQDDQKRMHLLDGQQRATSIFMAFRDPLGLKKIKTFQAGHTDDTLPILFLDMQIPDRKIITGNRKYVFRLITKSHPWGYARAKNRDRLKTSKKWSLLTKLGKSYPDVFDGQTLDEYFDRSLKHCLPFDAECPIPFHLFLNSSSAADLRERVDEWHKSTYGVDFNFPKFNQKGFYSFEEIYNLIHIRLNGNLVQEPFKIPVLRAPVVAQSPEVGGENLNLQVQIEKHPKQKKELDDGETDDNEEDDQALINEDEQDLDDFENMFLRLSIGGTRPPNEDVNYAIIKTKLESETVDLVKEFCGHLFDPARFVSLVYLMFKSDQSQKPVGGLRIKPLTLQSELGSRMSKLAFNKFLCDVISKLSENSFPTVLFYHKSDNPRGISKLQWLALVRHSPSLIIILIWRLYRGNDTQVSLKRNMQKVIGCLSLAHVFTNSRKALAIQDSIVREGWPVIQTQSDEFWSVNFVRRLQCTWKVFNFPEVRLDAKLWCDRIASADLGQKQSLKSVFTGAEFENAGTREILERLLESRFILHYFQRDYLDRTVPDERLFLEEHNMPFDYDHIAPNSWFRGSRGNYVSELYKVLGGSIGNLRILPFSENRSLQDVAPASRFGSERLLNDAGCDSGWKKIQDLKQKEEIRKRILGRFSDIIEDWNTGCQISQLTEEMKRDDVNFEKWVSELCHQSENKFGHLVFKLEDWSPNLGLYFFIMYVGKKMFTENEAIVYGVWLTGTGNRQPTAKLIPVPLAERFKKRFAESEISQDDSFYTTCKYTLLNTDAISRKDFIQEMNNYLSRYGFRGKYFK